MEAASTVVEGFDIIQKREVATGVVNLGNTCYINAVLQALAHAPELCLAIECESHYKTCPVALRNSARRQKNLGEAHDAAHLAANVDNKFLGVENREAVLTRTTRSCKAKNSRRNRRSPSCTETNSDDLDEFCLLCEIEKHLIRVHSSGSFDSTVSCLKSSECNGSTEAVAPSTFVHGFIKHVAPGGFKLGVQEDSHEFLRLLIDEMQKCCVRAGKNEEATSNNKTRAELENHTETKDKKEVVGDTKIEHSLPSNRSDYAFRLFRGTVESIVTCSNCGAISSKIDPIEDIGLEVTSDSSGKSTSNLASTRNLLDVTSALDKFTAMEHLDSGYKCEKCGETGSATKQSRLVSIPPILTLHLKRFRYGSNGKNVGQSFPYSRRRNSELSSLLNSGVSGTSGSAKIEGHVKFEQVFDIRPYLTEEKKCEIKSMFCRLFAVVVHAGKNSHSGHYISYVRNVQKNEWWKMDDSRVTRVAKDEVVGAEAYMLFYRVVDHPVLLVSERWKKPQNRQF